MHDFYEILQISKSSSSQAIKASYQKLVLLSHPDKPTGNVGEFVKIQKAYETLSCPEKREQYDLLLKSTSNHGVIQDHVTLEEFDHDNDDLSYSYPCRCGSIYLISKEELDEGVDVLECDGCSLCIKITSE